MTFRCYWQPKSDHRLDEWEDGAAYSEERGVAAVADGASSSFEAQTWARDLVSAFVGSPPRTMDTEAFEAWTGSVADGFGGRGGVSVEPTEAVVGAPVAGAGDGDPRSDGSGAGDPAADGGPAPWYVAEAAARGAFATFVGLQFTETPDARRWRALAVGDACCFHVRAGELLDAFPVDDPSGFDSSPPLLSTVAFRGSHGGHHLVARTGPAETGDVLYLATDAMAEWLLRRAGSDAAVWATLASLDHEGFAALVADARSAGTMADDDVTLLRAVVGPRT